MLENSELGLRVLVAGLRGALRALEPLLDDGEVGEGELELDDLAIANRIDGAHDVNDVGVLEAAHDVDDGVGVADVGEELVAEAFAFGGPFHEPGDVDELHDGRDYLFGLHDVR